MWVTTAWESILKDYCIEKVEKLSLRVLYEYNCVMCKEYIFISSLFSCMNFISFIWFSALAKTLRITLNRHGKRENLCPSNMIVLGILGIFLHLQWCCLWAYFMWLINFFDVSIWNYAVVSFQLLLLSCWFLWYYWIYLILIWFWSLYMSRNVSLSFIFSSLV